MTRDPFNVAVGEQMRGIRHRLGWSLQTAEQYTGLASVVVGSYERADRNPSLTNLRRWVEAFGHRIQILGPNDRVVSTDEAGFEWVSYVVVYGPGRDQVLECASEAEANAVTANMPGAQVGHRVNRRGAISLGGLR